MVSSSSTPPSASDPPLPPDPTDDNPATKKVKNRDHPTPLPSAPTPLLFSFKDAVLSPSTPPHSGPPPPVRQTVTVADDEVVYSTSNGIDSITFLDPVHHQMKEAMGFAVVISPLGRRVHYKALITRLSVIWHLHGELRVTDCVNGKYIVTLTNEDDYNNAILNGPWTLGSNYLMVYPWTPTFHAHANNLTAVALWLRIPALPVHYFHETILWKITKPLGTFIKADHSTLTAARGQYARIAVQMDLSQPLKGMLEIDACTYKIEYEDLPIICFSCGKYGHSTETCPTFPRTPSQALAATDLVSPPAATVQPDPISPSTAPFDRPAGVGEWMRVQKRVWRGPSAKSSPTVGNATVGLTNPFTVLQGNHVASRSSPSTPLIPDRSPSASSQSPIPFSQGPRTHSAVPKSRLDAISSVDFDSHHALPPTSGRPFIRFDSSGCLPTNPACFYPHYCCPRTTVTPPALPPSLAGLSPPPKPLDPSQGFHVKGNLQIRSPSPSAPHLPPPTPITDTQDMEELPSDSGTSPPASLMDGDTGQNTDMDVGEPSGLPL
ncbi:hypothetical protein K2173_025650 [Erythroxylum novogranatense]|uniref:CCHC-type domain-containing protein n=1 Tax=Erythroxylum novogranatense TaxID=1862640 RepID=A0AAV8SBA2_9ROSI|nr:hypothetical protein K2173_025650 [Erythroxylum novogranatense]